jgi:hypothetical protein
MIFSGKAKVKNIFGSIIDAIIQIYTKQFPMPDRASAIVIGISSAGAGTETSFFTFALSGSNVYALQVIGQCNSSNGVENVC